MLFLLVVVVWLFPAVPWICLQFVSVLFPDQPHLLFFMVQSITLISDVDHAKQMLLFFIA